jgi:hypothetical protein
MDDLFGVTEIAKQIIDEEAAHNPATTTEKEEPKIEEAAATGDAAEHAEHKE